MKILLMFFLCMYYTAVLAQGTWTPKANFPGTARYEAVGFSIANKGYIGTGRDGSLGNFKDFWEYNPVTDTWAQKADFGGGDRCNAVGFSIGAKGYIGTGANEGFKKDFWEYDPTNNSWSQKANFGGTARYDAVGFSIGNKGYIGTGTDGSAVKDFWEYDPIIDQWNVKSDFGGTVRTNAIAFAINNKGYVGGGSNQTDFWTYNPVSDQWTVDSPFSTTAGYVSSAFSTSSKGYIKYESGNQTIFKEYNPSDQTWILKDSFPETYNQESVGFSINDIGYIGTGTKNTGGYSNHLWQYDPCKASVQGQTYFCQGESTVLTASAGTSYLWSNGNVTQSTTINAAGDYSVTVSQSTACGTTTDSKIITINYITPSASISFGNGYGCVGQKVSFNSSLSCLEATSWEWDFGDSNSGTYTSTLENPDHVFVSSGTYTVTLKINGTYTTSKNIFINTSPSVDLGIDKLIHEGETVTLDAGYLSWQWGYYNWSTGQTSQIIEAYIPGNYYVEVCLDDFYSGLCCVKDTILVTIVLGIEEENNFTTCTLSPNPFSVFTTLKLDKNLNNAVLTIYNMYGQEIKKIEGVNGNTIILHRENLPNGVYVIRLEEGKNIFTEKIIIKD
ncbi:MAG: T9SS type A sorting domain-containing protein [Cytophagaceae bacterium]|nr:T9SS type A sorting domain-containing protein [Cytophagaceae bacterium]